MLSKSRRIEADIDVTLTEQLTSDSCTKLVIELIKYVLYQKEQIPFTCDYLTQMQAKLKSTDRNYSLIKTLLNSLKNISDHLSTQFLLTDCKVKEIVIIVGATIISPKLCIRLEIPSCILNSQTHLEYQHSSRKPLINLMRSMMDCTKFQDAMTLSLSPTNVFVLLQKSDCNSESDFFVPKPQYIPPTQVPMYFRIRFTYDTNVKTNCTCSSLVNVYREPTDMQFTEDENMQFTQYPDNSYRWYQSREVIKGFKFSR